MMITPSCRGDGPRALARLRLRLPCERVACSGRNAAGGKDLITVWGGGLLACPRSRISWGRVSLREGFHWAMCNAHFADTAETGCAVEAAGHRLQATVGEVELLSLVRVPQPGYVWRFTAMPPGPAL
jgi:hypothetical protein